MAESLSFHTVCGMRLSDSSEITYCEKGEFMAEWYRNIPHMAGVCDFSEFAIECESGQVILNPYLKIQS